MTNDPGQEQSPAKVNQQKIAEKLGISRTTVSRFDLASQLGYQHMEMHAPTKARTVSSRCVGVLVCTDIEEYLRGAYESPGVSAARA